MTVRFFRTSTPPPRGGGPPHQLVGNEPEPISFLVLSLRRFEDFTSTRSSASQPQLFRPPVTDPPPPKGFVKNGHATFGLFFGPVGGRPNPFRVEPPGCGQNVIQQNPTNPPGKCKKNFCDGANLPNSRAGEVVLRFVLPVGEGAPEEGPPGCSCHRQNFTLHTSFLERHFKFPTGNLNQM